MPGTSAFFRKCKGTVAVPPNCYKEYVPKDACRNFFLFLWWKRWTQILRWRPSGSFCAADLRAIDHWCLSSFKDLDSTVECKTSLLCIFSMHSSWLRIVYFFTGSADGSVSIFVQILGRISLLALVQARFYALNLCLYTEVSLQLLRLCIDIYLRITTRSAHNLLLPGFSLNIKRREMIWLKRFPLCPLCSFWKRKKQLLANKRAMFTS